MPFEIEKLREVHIELTSKCNAACPMCQRTYFGGRRNTAFTPTEIRMNEFKKIFPLSLVQQLDKVMFCGNLGDAIVAKDFLEIVQYLRQSNSKLIISLHTNGSLHSTEWWGEFAKVVGEKYGYVCFAIDGLEDTHELHRRKTDFATVLRNAKAFISAGGVARWYFLVFKHNQHQVDEARSLAKSLGFTQFNARRSHRFRKFGSDSIVKSPVKDINDNTLYFLHEADSKNFPADSAPVFAEESKFLQFLDEVPIRCQAEKERSVYISAEGHVYPCCFTHSCVVQKTTDARIGLQFQGFLEQNGGLDSIDAKKRSFAEIMSSPLFENLKSSWECSSVEEGKPVVCAQSCGKYQLSSQVDNRIDFK